MTKDQMADAITFGNPATQLCPFQAYNRLRKEAPVYLDPVTGNYVLTRYEDVRKTVLDHARFSNNAGLVGRRESSVKEKIDKLYEEKGWRVANSVQTMDQPRHRSTRSLFDKAFAHWSVNAASDYIERQVNLLIDGFIDRGHCEFVSEFCVQLSMRVIANQIGVLGNDPVRFERDTEKLRNWSDRSVELISPIVTPERELALTYEIIELQHFCARNIERVRATPDETLLSKLVEVVRDENGEPDIPEILQLMIAVLVAGNETTRFALAAGVKILIDRPELVNEVRDDEDGINAFVEESLRLMSPVQVLFRRALEDVTIGDVTIPAGARVEVRYGSANRDPELFDRPETFDLLRKNAKSHMAFGTGIHICVGMTLARAELRSSFRNILRRMKDFRPACGEDSYAYSPIYVSHGLTKLELAFDKRDA